MVAAQPIYDTKATVGRGTEKPRRTFGVIFLRLTRQA
jgi:hypothetical protein